MIEGTIVTTDQANSAASPHDNTPDAPTSVKDVATLIPRVLRAAPHRPAPNQTAAQDTFQYAFAAEAAIDHSDTLDKIYVAVTAPNIITMQDHYDSLASVLVDDAATLRTFGEDTDDHVFLVCTAASMHHPEPKIHFRTGLQVLNKPVQSPT